MTSLVFGDVLNVRFDLFYVRFLTICFLVARVLRMCEPAPLSRKSVSSETQMKNQDMALK
jgi:hypothetical protein